MEKLSLSDISAKLEAALEHTEDKVEYESRLVGLSPLDMRDANGRYILLDAYVALAQIRILEVMYTKPLSKTMPEGDILYREGG